MPIRIHRAVGYGMPMARFNALLKVQPDQDKYEFFVTRFAELSVEDLLIPKEAVQERLQFAPYPLCRDLLSRTSPLSKQEASAQSHARPDTLFKFVMTPDEITDIIFFPNAMYAKAWFRSDCTIDYTFETYGEDENGNPSANMTKYLRHGIYPYDRFQVDKAGEPVPFDDYGIQYREDGRDIRGAVPFEIRWYLTKFDFLDDAAVDELRPVMARWWA